MMMNFTCTLETRLLCVCISNAYLLTVKSREVVSFEWCTQNISESEYAEQEMGDFDLKYEQRRCFSGI